MRYEACTNEDFIGVLEIDYPSVLDFRNFLMEYGYNVPEDLVPIVDTQGNWYLQELKYHFKPIQLI